MKWKFALALAAAAATAVGVAGAAQDEGRRKVEKRVIVRHAAGGSFLGVTLGEVEGEGRGAKVRSVEPGSPAEKAGLKEADVVVRFDGEAVRSSSQLARLVRETPAGKPVAIEVDRGGAPQKLTATLGEGRRHMSWSSGPGEEFDLELPAPPEPPEAPAAPGAPPAPPHVHGSLPRPPAPPAMPHVWRFDHEPGDMMLRMMTRGPRRLGVEYIELGDQLAAYFKVSGKGGVLVTSVDAEGPAGKAGLKAGDVILKFGDRSIDGSSDLREAVVAAEAGKEVALAVLRDGRPVDVKVTLAEPRPPKHRRAGGVSL